MRQVHGMEERQANINMKTIPLSSRPSQLVNIVLDGQNCDISVYQKTTGLYLDLTADGKLMLQGRICRDNVYMLMQEHLGFRGNLLFIDRQGSSDPNMSELGSRYELVYLEEGEV